MPQILISVEFVKVQLVNRTCLLIEAKWGNYGEVQQNYEKIHLQTSHSLVFTARAAIPHCNICNAWICDSLLEINTAYSSSPQGITIKCQMVDVDAPYYGGHKA